MDSRLEQAAVGRLEDVDLYVRTYRTVLRTSGEVHVRALERAHINVCPTLHAGAGEPELDLGALIYAVNRLPAVIGTVKRVILGQLPEHFEQALGSRLDDWQAVQAPARRRQWHYDARDTLAVHVASTSDIDDVIPTLVAYQIEWNKLHAQLQADKHLRTLLDARAVDASAAHTIRDRLAIDVNDWDRLTRAWGPQFWTMFHAIAAEDKDLLVRQLGGTDVGFAKLTRGWWQPIGAALAQRGLLGRPLYFVSSNMHSLVNLISGYAPRRAPMLWKFLSDTGTLDPSSEAAELATLRGQSNAQNVLYYAARLWHQAHPHSTSKSEREGEELERGILNLAAVEGADVGAQIIELGRLRPEDFDPRLADVVGAVHRSDAVVVNIDYPLGMGAYHILRQVAEAVDNLAGVYVLGKAATLNGDIGDVLIADFVRDEHSGNTISFDNVFSYADVAPFLERGSVLDNQRAVTVKGTFLQNREYLDLFYRESDTVVEMEAGPFLSAVYEATQVSRYPNNEAVHFRRLPIDVGLIHYASDTPYTRARTLGSRNLSFEGVDSTYAAAIAILRRILDRERWRSARRSSVA